MFLEKLKEFPKTKSLVIATVITFVPFILITAFFIINEYKLKTTTGYGVLNFEFARTSQNINRVFTAWGPNEIKEQTAITYLDYLAIFFYALFGTGLILIISRKLEGKLQNLGLIMALSFIIAGLFDALENINLLLMLGNKNYASSAIPFFAFLFSTFKIIFLAIGLVFVFITVIYLMVKRMKMSQIYLYMFHMGGGLFIIWLISLWNHSLSFLIGAVYIIMYFFIRKWLKI
jgi:hypothetical protein